MSELKQGDLFALKYRVVSVLGRGAFATVYLVDHLMRDERSALKLLNLDVSDRDNTKRRLVLEAMTMSTLKHPFIVTVREIEQYGDRLFIVMEYLQNGSLQKRLEKQGAMPSVDACLLIVQVLEGLAVAHAHRVVHRDIKPGNILLSDDGSPKIGDFGIAHPSGHTEHLTRQGSALGTPWFMPPEQKRVLAAHGPEADLFAVGVMLHYVISGIGDRIPEGVTFYEQIAEEPELIELVPDVLRPFIAKATKQNPTDRFRSAEEMINALHELIPFLPTAREELEARGASGSGWSFATPAGTQFHWSQGGLEASADGGVSSGAPLARPTAAPVAVAVEPRRNPPADGTFADEPEHDPSSAAELNLPSPQKNHWKVYGAGVASFIVLLIVIFAVYGLGGDRNASHAPSAIPAEGVVSLDGSTTPTEAVTSSEASVPVATVVAAPTSIVSTTVKAGKPQRADKAKKAGKPDESAQVETLVAQPEPTGSRVTFVGADVVRVVGDAGNFTLPASVPPGIYAVFAQFAGTNEVRALARLKVGDEPVVLHCDLDMRLCTSSR